MSKEAYRKKLMDPRWQKKRLEILNRDEFTCQICSDKERTLHVHHKRYSPGDPWDINSQSLVTLCADCHEDEGLCISDSMDLLTKTVRDRFSTSEIEALAFWLYKKFNPAEYGHQDAPEISWYSDEG